MKYEKWKMKNEKWKMKIEKWNMKNEKWKMKNEKMKNEKWKIKNEKWKMKNEEDSTVGSEEWGYSIYCHHIDQYAEFAKNPSQVCLTKAEHRHFQYLKITPLGHIFQRKCCYEDIGKIWYWKVYTRSSNVLKTRMSIIHSVRSAKKSCLNFYCSLSWWLPSSFSWCKRSCLSHFLNYQSKFLHYQYHYHLFLYFQSQLCALLASSPCWQDVLLVLQEPHL